ncbi:MAG: flagellar biosynthetic protein FliR, partial [Ignavibacteriaceae bacterium]|nr:flagellar biosynthetic protein FliR [Ignavibacteriaceae bacterium]
MFGIKEFIILFLIFIRISSAFVISPIFGGKVIPVISKIFLALVIAYIVFLTIDKSSLYELPTGWM